MLAVLAPCFVCSCTKHKLQVSLSRALSAGNGPEDVIGSLYIAYSPWNVFACNVGAAGGGGEAASAVKRGQLVAARVMVLGITAELWFLLLGGS